MASNSSVHLNGNVICVIDVETTGLDPEIHEIMEVCFLPLDSTLKPRKDIIPFEVQIKPEHPETADMDAVKISKMDFLKLCETGLDPYIAGDLFLHWIEKLKLPERKRLSPLAHNWKFDQAFIKVWLGETAFSTYIDGRSRDTMEVALFLNDRADRRNEEIPFPKVNLGYLASQLKIPHNRAHRALDDCVVTAEVYRHFVKNHMI